VREACSLDGRGETPLTQSNILNNQFVIESKADSRNHNNCVVSRHSGMPSAGIQSAGFLDSGQNRAGMTEG